MLADLEQTDQAIKAYEKALRLVPTYADAQYNLAAVTQVTRGGRPAAHGCGHDSFSR